MGSSLPTDPRDPSLSLSCETGRSLSLDTLKSEVGVRMAKQAQTKQDFQISRNYLTVRSRSTMKTSLSSFPFFFELKKMNVRTTETSQ
jgi:hypothetical protein